MEKKAIGLIIGMNVIKEAELFDHSHVLKAIHRVVSGAKEVDDSFYSFRDPEHPFVFLYLEIKKTRGAGFSGQELRRLRDSLPSELKESIECLSPSLFIPRNEEEIYRNIVQISKELKYVHDLPQVMISFQEQSSEHLRFTVIILRLLKENFFSLEELIARLPQTVRYIPDYVSQVGKLRKKYPKEASVFTLEVESSLFFRKNYSIDLLRARQYIAKALMLMIGDFRDYNGGFLSKQNEQLELIKNALGEEGKKHSFLIETLFYSLTPSLIQTLLMPEAGQGLVGLFLEALIKEPSNDKSFLLLKTHHPDFFAAVYKTKQKHMEQYLYDHLQQLSLPMYQWGHAVHQMDGWNYLCFLYQYPASLTAYHQFDSLFEKLAQCENREPSLPAFRQVLKINFQDGDPPSLNPHIGIDLRCRSLQKALFEGLTRLNNQGVAELAAAEHASLSECKTRYIFKLRAHQWSNGEEVSAYQFERAWKKALCSESPSLRPDLFYSLKHAKEVYEGKLPSHHLGVKALDHKNLEVILEHPSPYFLELLAHPIFSPIYGEAEEPTVFNGPFLLRSWVRDRSLSLARNPYYWDVKKVKLSGVEISIIKDPFNALKMYENKEFDWIGGPFSILPMEKILHFKKKGLLKTKDIMGIAWIYCNTQHELLRSAKIRKALAYAIDRKKICEQFFGGQLPSKTLLPGEMSFFKEDELYQDGDSEAACSLFHEGLKEEGLTKKDFSRLLFLHSDVSSHRQFAGAIREQWEQTFDIRLQTKEMEWNTLSSTFDSRNFQLGICFRHFFYRDPLYIFNLFKEPTNAHNASSWENPLFKTFLDQALYCADPAEKVVNLKKAESLLLEEMPVIPVLKTAYQYLCHEQLKGIHLCHSGDVDFKWIYFE